MRQPFPRPRHVNEGAGRSLCEELHKWLATTAHPGTYGTVWAQECDGAFFSFLAKVCRGGAWPGSLSALLVASQLDAACQHAGCVAAGGPSG